MNANGTIELNSSDAKVYITGSNRSTAHVKIFRKVTTKGVAFGQEDFFVEVSEAKGDLYIREKAHSTVIGMIGYSHEEYTIRIEAPEGTSLEVNGDDGDYLITNINGVISLDLDDADVDLTGCSGDSFDFRLDDGDIRMDEGRGRLEINGDDADIEIKNAQFTSVIADLDDGDFIVETSLADNGEYMIRAQDGLIDITITKGGGKFDIRHDDSRITTVGNFEEVQRSESRTSLSLASGTARVDIHSDDARVRLTKR